MASDPHDRSSGVQERGESLAPLTGTREQRMQRMQIGLVGLGAMILLVGLANIILTTARENEAATTPEEVQAVADEDVPPPPPRDPLADAGVVPEIPVETGAPPADPAGSAQQQGTGNALPPAAGQ